MGPVPWQIMKCCHRSIMGINHLFRPQDTLCEVHAEICSLSPNNIPPKLLVILKNELHLTNMLECLGCWSWWTPGENVRHQGLWWCVLQEQEETYILGLHQAIEVDTVGLQLCTYIKGVKLNYEIIFNNETMMERDYCSNIIIYNVMLHNVWLMSNESINFPNTLQFLC